MDNISGKSFKLILFAFIFLAVSWSWANSLFIPFLNDDFQIIGFHDPQSFFDCFAPFWQNDVSVHFWRPIPNVVHSLNIYIFGFSPFAFHSINLALYLLLCILFSELALRIGMGRWAALAVSICFSAAPSHELFLGWIASRGDILAGIFILSASLFYLSAKSRSIFYYFAGISFLLAIMSKEIAFAGAALPLLFLLIERNNRDKRSAFIASAAAALSVALLLSGRYLIEGAHPFGSSNFTDASIFNSLYNICIYVPLSFFGPDSLESLAHSFSGSLETAAAISAAVLAALSILLINFIRIDKEAKLRIYFGALWFLLFILPASGLLMRWYFLIASFGLFIAFGEQVFVFNKLYKSIVAAMIALIFTVFSSIEDSRAMGNWIDTGHKVSNIMDSISNLDIKPGNKVYFWGAPDKINRINAMKIGFQELIHFASKDKSTDVRVPLKSEINKSSHIGYDRLSASSFRLLSADMRFMQQSGQSRSVISDEELNIKGKGYSLYIMTKYNKDINTATSAAIITLNHDISAYQHFYFNGKAFKEILIDMEH